MLESSGISVTGNDNPDILRHLIDERIAEMKWNGEL
jgi:hypothetical protein